MVTFPTRLTQEDTTGHTRDALDLSDIILYKVLVTGGTQARAIAEEAPECSGHCAIADNLRFGTGLKAAFCQRAVPKQTDPGAGRG